VTGMRPKLAIVVPALRDGGGVPAVARFIRDTVQRSGEFDLKLISLATSATDECNISLRVPRTWSRGVLVRDLVWEDVRIKHVGAVGGELEFQRFRPRKALERELGCVDLIQVVSGAPSWALSVLNLGKPVVLQVATRTILERRFAEMVGRGMPSQWRRLMTRITDKLDDRALRSVDAVLVENQSMLEYASSLAEGRSVWVRYGPPGVDTDLFCPLQGRLGETKAAGYVLSVGRFDDPRKNVGLLLESFATMRRQMADPPHLELAGPADPGPAFWRRVQALNLADVVEYHIGVSRDALVDLYQNALCLALSSDEEGLGMVILEAMACGVPVVATRCGGPEGIITDGVDGYLVRRGDAHGLAGRLRRLAEDPLENDRMGINARLSVEERFSHNKTGEVYLDTYRRLLSGALRSS